MTMNDRSPWPAWAATAIAVLGLVGLAAAQSTPYASTDELLTTLLPGDGQPTTYAGSDPAPVIRPIHDDGRDTDLLPVIEELIIARSEGAAPIGLRILDEQGRVVRTAAMANNDRRTWSVDLRALDGGRYVAWITGERQAEAVRFQAR